MRVGVFCGSFDPIHTGHAMVANYLGQWCGLDEVLLMVSPLNPFKVDAPPAADRHRLRMAEIVASRCTSVKVSDFEFQFPLPTYTYRTLTELKKLRPDDDFVLIIGSDNWAGFDRWREATKIKQEFEIMIYPRPGYPLTEEEATGAILLSAAPQALISSTMVREALKEDKNLNYLLPIEVFEYIKQNNLYR